MKARVGLLEGAVMARGMRAGVGGSVPPAGEPRPWRVGGAILLIGFWPLLGACTGATVGSGVGETRLEQAPWYAGRAAGSEMARVAFLPVAWQPGASQAPMFDPAGDDGTALAELLRTMTEYLATLDPEGVVGPVEAPPGTPPDVEFGCETDGTDECLEREEQEDGFGTGNPPMRLAVGRPSADWAGGAAVALEKAGADALLVLTVEVGQYWPRQTNRRGSKVVELGTDHVMPLPWLTSLETPVQVLQVTGALVGPDGKAIRIGAEGLLARRTPLLASGFGLQALLGDEDVEAVLTERREDLPGQPLVWEMAVRSLLTELAGVR